MESCSWSWSAPLAVFTVATFVKILLIPAYRSTDFEVHRNWLAITYSLPISEWYYESSSQWTLDYPPFFAYFEYLLSFCAAMVDSLIVRLDSLDYASPSCVLFQRLSVIASDITLLYAIHQYCVYQRMKSNGSDGCRRCLVVSLLVLFNYGLLIVDHIHFQFNGFMYGILLLSIVRLLQNRCLEGALLFSLLLNLKHIYLYVGPAYFVYLLKHYCYRPAGGVAVGVASLQHMGSQEQLRHYSEQQLQGRGAKKEVEMKFPGMTASTLFLLKGFLPWNLVMLGGVVLLIFALSFGPFIYMGQIGQVISRLFPFKRGLCHAYWAPNIWALYSFADMIIALIGNKLGKFHSSGGGSMTSGLVGGMKFQVLPDIAPWVTVILTLLSMLPCLFKLWLRPSSPVDFLKTLILCAYSSFLFGWHVHEKAVMLITLPMCFLAVEQRHYSRVFVILSTIAHISLFPLLNEAAETPIKVALFTVCAIMIFMALGKLSSAPGLDLQYPEETSIAHAVTPMPTESEPVSPETDGQPPLGLGPTTTTMPRQRHTLSSHVARSTSSNTPSASLENSNATPADDGWQLSWLEVLYMGLVILGQVYCVFLHGLFGFLARFQFLPLLLTSVSCAVGLLWTWIIFYYYFLFT